MFQALLEGLTTFGPMLFLMLTPVLIPLTVETLGAIADRRKRLATTPRTLTQADLTTAA